MRTLKGASSRFVQYVTLGLLLAHCARSPLKSPDQALRLSPKPIVIADDLNLASLKDGFNDLVLAHEGRLKEPLRFGSRMVDRNAYVNGLKKLQKALEKGGAEFYRVLSSDFDVYECYGDKEFGDVFVTSYFEPVIKASKKPTKALTQALYSLPKDLVVVDVKAYQERFPNSPWVKTAPDEQKTSGSILRGRLLNGDLPRVVPYFDRKEIDEMKSLKGRGLEIAYTDPIDAFVLQIQGSGTLVFPGGEKWKVGYTGQNGYPYVPIGKFLTDKIPLEKMSLQRIERALRELPVSEQQRLMNENPSYVFFRILPGAAQTYFGTRVLGGRTIATDQTLFPKGVLSLLEFDHPVFASDASEDPQSSQKVRRLVFDQDTGGAIRGPGRVDLFWGAGDEAKRYAGVMKSRGKLFYFVPKGL